MTSRVHRTQSSSAVFGSFFHHLLKLNIIASYEYQKNECVQQWNLFKCQTSAFYFSTYCPNLLLLLSTIAQLLSWPQCCTCHFILVNNTDILEMGRSSVNAEVRPKNSALCSARFGSATFDYSAEVQPNFGKNLASLAALLSRYFAAFLRFRRR